jgi:hypothetical protein
MKKYLRAGVFGVLTWLIPFVVALFFYTREGQLTINETTFKTIMIVVGAVTGAFLLVLYFKKIEQNFLTAGIIIGILWFAINILLDLLVLVPMSKMPIGTYFLHIGLRYLNIPIMSTVMGSVAKKS